MKMLHALRDKVLETGAEVGLGFDGDGDRCGVVDNEGEEIFADKVGVMADPALGSETAIAFHHVMQKMICVQVAFHAVTGDIRTALQRGGVTRSHISTRTYAVQDPKAEAPIRLSYAALQATAGPCGAWPKNIGGGINRNLQYENYGCSTQANLAAMVDNPSDLITPRASTPVDQQRRAVVIENYRSGDVTTSSYTEGVGAEVSE